MALMKIGFPLSTVARNFNKVRAGVLAANLYFFSAIKKSLMLIIGAN